MKTLSAWILGIFALGLAIGSFVSGSGAGPEPAEPDLETALDSASVLSQVDCGDGREGLLEPVEVDGAVSFKLRCVATPPAVGIRPAPDVAPTQPRAALPLPEPDPAPASDVTPVDVDEGERSRTWKESAVVIGGAAGAGAGIGAIAKGKKGAAVGAAIGAAGGAAYELIKKDKNN